jgi:hypothetical protein
MNKYTFAPIALVALLAIALGALLFVPAQTPAASDPHTFVAWLWVLRGLRG